MKNKTLNQPCNVMQLNKTYKYKLKKNLKSTLECSSIKLKN